MFYRLYIQTEQGSWWQFEFPNPQLRQEFMTQMRPIARAWASQDDTTEEHYGTMLVPPPRGVEIHQWAEHAR